MKQIPPVDLTRQHELIEQELATAVLAVLKSGRYIGGTAVTDFEQQFANYIGVSECVGCNSGTDALYLALRALNIGQGDEVITTSFTFIATAEVITRVGAKPVFIDINPDTFNLDLNLIEAAITERTKAIIPVHLFGQPIDMTRLMAIADRHNLYVIEDCAQAIGAEWHNHKVGSIGYIGCFSFFPTKNLGACGDAGALTTNDQNIAVQVRLLREHGLERKSDQKISYRHLVTGLNSRLDALQATILQIKLRYLEQWNQQRTEAAQYYQQILQPLPALKLPKTLLEGKSVWNQYTIRIPDLFNQSELTRDLIRSQLGQMGVISMVYYPLPLHLQPVYQSLGYQKGQLPVCEQAAQEVLSLPLFPGIETEEQQQVAYCLKDCLSFLPNH
ncbi:Glutamine--scyllo-inositol transaminase [Stanieria cyanosphaera PCC 7437]|uniref:Glutamine--scyllo-inositol transaminase n=1 Tax=Stanieria cyanosphaera (strain ATCC 29371 / PCC 7437) TaxID=111780 RepID=K9XYW0_STAC7|nr:DegT/DnrJ/EryC1/StrS family aminotransferase [Stanieria cyanosphaera]AFZ37698.1 Glutamine--scyllo-inositol transaminase [Stanieria cyanosphaera PCC 7437]